MAEQKGPVRRVRGVTAHAVPLLHRFVFREGLPLPRKRVRMASGTKIGNLFGEKFLSGGRMGLVAVQTTRLINERPVNPVLTERFGHHRIMASPA